MKRKNGIIALILVVMMFASPFVYSIIQAPFYASPQTSQVQVPSNLVSSAYTQEQRAYLLQQGATIVSFKYNIACTDCRDAKAFLEDATRKQDYKQQIFLEELAGFNATSIEMSSARGTRTLTNTTQPAIEDAFCNTLIQPPINCALRKV